MKKADLSEEQMARFEAWFNNHNPPGFWQRYTKRYLGGVNKGGLTETFNKAVLVMQKAIAARQLKGLPEINSPEDFMRVCDLALDAQKQFFDECKRHNKFVPNFQKVTTWFNNNGWEYEVGSISEIKDKAPRQTPEKLNIPKDGKVVDIDKANEYRDAAKRKLGLIK